MWKKETKQIRKTHYKLSPIKIKRIDSFERKLSCRKDSLNQKGRK